MNQRKHFFRTLGGSMLAILANLAFAPIFQAGAASTPGFSLLAANEEHSPASADKSMPPQVHPQQTLPRSSAPQLSEPTAPSQPATEPKNDEFDGDTTFATNEASAGATSSISDAHLFSSFGSSAGSGGNYSKKQAHQSYSAHPQPAHGTPGEVRDQHEDVENTPPPSSREQAQNESEQISATNEPHQNNYGDDTIQVANADKPVVVALPEPSPIILLLVGFCGLIAMRRAA